MLFRMSSEDLHIAAKFDPVLSRLSESRWYTCLRSLKMYISELTFPKNFYFCCPVALRPNSAKTEIWVHLITCIAPSKVAVLICETLLYKISCFHCFAFINLDNFSPLFSTTLKVQSRYRCSMLPIRGYKIQACADPTLHPCCGRDQCWKAEAENCLSICGTSRSVGIFTGFRIFTVVQSNVANVCPVCDTYDEFSTQHFYVVQWRPLNITMSMFTETTYADHNCTCI